MMDEEIKTIKVKEHIHAQLKSKAALNRQTLEEYVEELLIKGISQ